MYEERKKAFVKETTEQFPASLRKHVRVREWGGRLSGEPNVAVGIDRDVVGPVGIERRLFGGGWFEKSHAAAVAHTWKHVNAQSAHATMEYLEGCL